jgi:hypothetical protein
MALGRNDRLHLHHQGMPIWLELKQLMAQEDGFYIVKASRPKFVAVFN